MIHVSKVSICGYEKGTKTPTLENLLNLLAVLDLKVEDIFEEKYTSYICNNTIRIQYISPILNLIV